MFDDFFSMTRITPPLLNDDVENVICICESYLPPTNFIRDERNITYNTTVNYGSKPANKKNSKKKISKKKISKKDFKDDVMAHNLKDLETKIAQHIASQSKKKFWFVSREQISNSKCVVVTQNDEQTYRRFFHLTNI